MKPVEQRGNSDCLVACLASILGVRYEDVPQAIAVENEQHNAMVGFLKERGFLTWSLGLHGAVEPMLMLGNEPIPFLLAPTGYWIASVKSPRIAEGFHSVVMRGRSIAFDPHPQREMGHGGFVEALILMPGDTPFEEDAATQAVCADCDHPEKVLVMASKNGRAWRYTHTETSCNACWDKIIRDYSQWKNEEAIARTRHPFKPGVVAAPPCGHCGHAHDYGNGACKETPCFCSGWVPVEAVCEVCGGRDEGTDADAELNGREHEALNGHPFKAAAVVAQEASDGK